MRKEQFMKKDSRTSQRSKKSKQLVYVLLPFVLPLCLIAIGILLMVNETLIDKLFLGLGILGALIGLVEVVIYASRRKYEVQPQYLVNGIILLVVGAALILIPFTINRFIPVLISLCVIASGISGVTNTFTFRKEGATIFVPVLFAVTNIVLGAFLFIYVMWINKSAGYSVIGILLIISGVIRIVNEILARTSVPKAAQVVETSYTETATASAAQDTAAAPEDHISQPEQEQQS